MKNAWLKTDFKCSEEFKFFHMLSHQDYPTLCSIIEENVRNVTTILKTEENLRIMYEVAMSENGFLQVLQALNSLNVFQALQVL